MEDMGANTACIRKMYNKKRTTYRKSNKQNGADAGKKDSDQTDKYCYYCGQHGHMTINCEFMAKLINATVTRKNRTCTCRTHAV
jgi:hypothetical protein